MSDDWFYLWINTNVLIFTDSEYGFIRAQVLLVYIQR